MPAKDITFGGRYSTVIWLRYSSYCARVLLRTGAPFSRSQLGAGASGFHRQGPMLVLTRSLAVKRCIMSARNRSTFPAGVTDVPVRGR